MPSVSKQSAEKRPVPSQFVGKNWKPGQSGNPNGRPRERLRPALRALLTDEDIQAMMTQAIADTVHPDPEVRTRARAWVMEQVDGKLVERREAGDPGDFESLSNVSNDELARVLKIVSKRKSA